MVTRTVFMKFKEQFSNDEERERTGAKASEVIGALPMVAACRFGVPADAHSQAAWDLCLLVDFEAADAIASYTVDPLHRNLIEETLKPRWIVVKAWNFHVK